MQTHFNNNSVLALFLLLASLFVFSSKSDAQIEYLENDLLQKFVNRGSAKKIRHFNGQMDGSHPILLSIIWDNFQCKGNLKYLASEENYYLSGKIDKGTFYLSEDNPRGDITGYITGQIEDKHFKGQWTNFNNTVGATIIAREIKSDYFKKNELDKFWIKSYSSTTDNYPVALLIQQVDTRAIVGNIWIEQKQESYYLEGSLDKKGNLLGNIMLRNGTKMGEILGRLKDNANSKLILKIGQDLKQVRFRLKSKSPIKKLSHAEFCASYTLSYPKLKDPSFNQWIDGLLRGLTSEFRISRKSDSPHTPANRSSERFSGTTFVEFMNDKIVSGWINIESTNHTFTQTIPFNYHLDLKRNLVFEDIFVKKEAILKDPIIIQAIDDLNDDFSNESLKNWIRNASFSKITFRKEGIHFSTEFNAIFGKLGFTLAYEKLTSHLRKEVLEVTN